MKVSIIIPTYNVAPYIQECLQSVAAQTYTGPIECLIVDDCGSDNSIQIAENFISGYRGTIDFRIIHREKNGGLSAARNTGIKHATGEYLYFLDSDDSISSKCIELLADLVIKYPNVDMVQGSAKSHLKFLSLANSDICEYSNDRSWIKSTLLKRIVVPMTAWNKLINHKFVIEHNLMFLEGAIHEDEIWNFCLSKHLCSVAFCKIETYIYRINANGIISSCSADINRFIPVYNYIANHISTPLALQEIFCLMSLIPVDFDYEREIDLRGNYGRVIRYFLSLRKILSHVSLNSPQGLLCRLLHKLSVVLLSSDMIIRLFK